MKIISKNDFFGLNPSSNNIALYECNHCDSSFMSNAGNSINCPSCGKQSKKIKAISDLDLEKVEKTFQCLVCGSKLYSNLPDNSIDSFFHLFHCPECGSSVTADPDNVTEKYDEDEIEEMAQPQLLTDDTDESNGDPPDLYEDDNLTASDVEDTDEDNTMEIISNFNQRNNHLKIIEDCLKLYSKAFFATAFLKMSGLNNLSKSIKDFLKKEGELTIIAGQNFALTEPNALKKIRKLLKPYPKSKLFLAKAGSQNIIFHPKIYFFKNDKDACIITGSANITSGGLINNNEISLSQKFNKNDKIWDNINQYFKELLKPENVDEATLLVIKQYETYYEKQKQHNKVSEPIPTKTKTQLSFDYKNLLKYFNEYNNSEREKSYRRKLNNYREAKNILDEIEKTEKLTRTQFIPLLDQLVGSKDGSNLWHSRSLLRLRRKVYPYHKEFQNLINFIKINKNKPASFVFEGAKELVNDIYGASINYVTEIMITYNRIEFANINQNPIKVLIKEGGVSIKKTTTSYSGIDYEEYCELIKEISVKLGLKDMLEADRFFSDIYWKIKKDMK